MQENIFFLVEMVFDIPGKEQSIKYLRKSRRFLTYQQQNIDPGGVCKVKCNNIETTGNK